MKRQIYIIGLSYGVKPYIILKTLSSFSLWNEKKVIFITDSDKGIAVDYAKEKEIPIILFSYNDLEASLDKIQDNNGMLVCIGWNKKIPSNFLSKFEHALNCHGGLLPDYRGEKTYMHCYANLEGEYGTTIHYMNNKFDDGNIILQGRLKSYIDETPEIMHRRISEATGMLIPYAIYLVENGYKGTIQQGKARYFFKMSREEMEAIRTRNLQNIKHQLPKLISKHKSWNLGE